MTLAMSSESSDWSMIASHLAFEMLPQLEKSFYSPDWEQHHMDPQNAPEVSTAWLGNTDGARSDKHGNITYGSDLYTAEWWTQRHLRDC